MSDRNTDFNRAATTLKATHSSGCCAKDTIIKTSVIRYTKISNFFLNRYKPTCPITYSLHISSFLPLIQGYAEQH